MEQSEWTEAQLIQFARDHGYTDMTRRKLKRFRQEGVVSTPRVDHSGFGGTTSVYPTEIGPRVLAICRLLKQKNDYDAVRIGLWLEGYPIEIGLLKESFWRLVPFSSLLAPSTASERRNAARDLTRSIGKEVWKSVRSNLTRKVLEQFEKPDDRRYFTSVLTQLLYGVPVDFTSSLLSHHDADFSTIREEPADLIADGLQVQQVRFLPKDSARDLQRLSDERLLSLTRLRTVLLAASEEDLELARTRRDIIAQLFEALDLIGYVSKPVHFIRNVFTKPNGQALSFVWLLVLDQSGYGPNIEMINASLHTNLPLIRRHQKLHHALQLELPEVAKELLSLFQVSLLFSEGSLKEREVHIERLREVYRQHKEALDAFWQHHPELSDEIDTDEQES